MRAKYLGAAAILFLLMISISRDARSQDEVPGPDLNSINSPDPNSYDEKPLLYESEGRNTRPAAVTVDTSHTKTQATPVKKAPTPADLRKPKDEDPLNFNFLFYIITKFKSSDLME